MENIIERIKKGSYIESEVDLFLMGSSKYDDESDELGGVRIDDMPFSGKAAMLLNNMLLEPTYQKDKELFLAFLKGRKYNGLNAQEKILVHAMIILSSNDIKININVHKRVLHISIEENISDEKYDDIFDKLCDNCECFFEDLILLRP